MALTITKQKHWFKEYVDEPTLAYCRTLYFIDELHLLKLMVQWELKLKQKTCENVFVVVECHYKHKFLKKFNDILLELLIFLHFRFAFSLFNFFTCLIMSTCSPTKQKYKVCTLKYNHKWNQGKILFPKISFPSLHYKEIEKLKFEIKSNKVVWSIKEFYTQLW